MRRRGEFGSGCVLRGVRAGAQESNLRDDAALRALKEGQSPAGGLGEGNCNGNTESRPCGFGRDERRSELVEGGIGHLQASVLDGDEH